MPTKNIRLNRETQGTVTGEGHRRMVVLPEGCEIAPLGQVAEHPEMVEVRWDGQSVWLFAIDFEARTKVEVPNGDDRQLLTRATSVGAATPEPDKPEVPTSTQQTNTVTPKVRRFNAAGRELF